MINLIVDPEFKRKEYYQQWHKNNIERRHQKDKKRRRSFNGKLKTIYLAIKKRTIHRKWGNMISEQEFMSFAENNKAYKDLYEIWVENGYKQIDCPSIDRIDNNKGYIQGNLQFISKSQNSFKSWHVDKAHENCKKKIVALKDNKILLYPSAASFARYLNMKRSNIVCAANTHYKVKGWKVRYYQTKFRIEDEIVLEF